MLDKIKLTQKGTSKPEPKAKASSAHRARKAKTGGPASIKSSIARSVSTPVVALPFFRKLDWLCCAVTALVVLASYLITVAPDLTLEDSGEMAVASAYAGVPHAPGYPVWTLYTWIFTKLLPFSNIAWRVAVASAFAGALACGMIALMVSRAAALSLDRFGASGDGAPLLSLRMQKFLPGMSGFVAGTLMGFDGLLWSQSVIVEVYALSVLSLTVVMALLFRWMYVPHQRRYLYLAWFMFGICLNNHQSLIVIVLAMEVCVVLADAKLGRDLLFGNALCYFAGLYVLSKGGLVMLSTNPPLLIIYHLVGVGSVITTAWLILKTRGLGGAGRRVLACGSAFVAGLAFYLCLPIFSMANPPMNWAYPRTASGFLHGLTRGQYDSVHPVTSLGQYLGQLWTVGEGIADEFYPVYLAVGLLPFILWKRLARRERRLVWGMAAFYLTLGPMLLVLLNPGTDRGSQAIVKVFFAASHVPIAMAIGLGLALGAWLVLQWSQEVRRPVLIALAVSVGWGIYHAASTWGMTNLAVARWAALYGVLCTVLFAGLSCLRRTGGVQAALISLLCLLPIHSVLAHWWGNEQRGHLFGFWFGHDMFCPPFKGETGLSYSRVDRERQLQGAEGSLIYPEMSADAVLFGGTDPGRFCPTYMIFCESFLPQEQRRNPEFDRRDVRIITQNALADRHYLEYIRAHYQRSAQQDPFFFQELLGSKCGARFLGRLLLPLDRALTGVGARVEKRRCARGVYPAKELRLPSDEDLQKCMSEYVRDLQARAQRGQLKPGEEVRVVGNQMVFSGQATVMGVNALLTREIFARNPEHEFYVEESFPLEWMYPHLEPFGTILKLKRTPQLELENHAVERDRRFWRDYMSRLMGDWVKPETNIAEICTFAEAVHLRRDLEGYGGSTKFLRDEQAQKSFSKLRTSIGGLYDWRFRAATGQLQQIELHLSKAGLAAGQAAPYLARQQQLVREQQRMFAEAEFAYKQAFALCPYSPEIVQRFVNLLASVGRLREALALAEVSTKLDPGSGFFSSVAAQLRQAVPATTLN